MNCFLVIYVSAYRSADLDDSNQWKIVYKNAHVKADMENFQRDSRDRHDEVMAHLHSNPLETDGTIVLKMSGQSRTFKPYEYRLPHWYRLIYLVHVESHELEILRIDKHFK